MKWFEAFALTFAVFAGIGCVFFLPLLLCGAFDKLLEGYRRKKHPEYFKYWDESLKLSFERGAKYNQCKQRFDYYLKLYNEGLRDGECTYEYYSERMNRHMEEYRVVCDWFQKEEKKIRELLTKADLYAKEHNLLWGIIYDTKCK